MSERRGQREDWRETLGREFNRPTPDSTASGQPQPSGPTRPGAQREMFPAICASCGKETQVPFRPRSDRPVYCSDCFRGRQGSDEAPRSSPRHADAAPQRTAGPGLPEGYLRSGYFDETGSLRPELIVEQARSIAEELDRAKLSTAALRRFFGMTRRAESRLEAERSFAVVRADILALKPFAASAQTREVIPSLFREFLDRNVEQAVLGEREFLKGFLPHFQYVVAYFPKK